MAKKTKPFTNTKKIPFLVSEYTSTLDHVRGKGTGIQLMELNLSTGELFHLRQLAKLENPSYMSLSHNNSHLYAISEVCEFRGKRDGKITSYQLSNPNSNMELIEMQQCSSHGAGPAYCTPSLDDSTLLNVNYVHGNLTTHPILADGTIDTPSSNIQLEGNGPIRQRQEQAHPHAINQNPHDQLVYLCDLGSDSLIRYQLDTSSQVDFFDKLKLPAGSGPRHIAFHPQLNYSYISLELSSQLASIHHSASPNDTKVCDLSAASSANNDANFPSELTLTIDGKFLYLANRGANTISLFSLDNPAKPELVESIDCGGTTPRHIALSPNEDFLIVANQDSDALVSFQRDKTSGRLIHAHTVDQPTPCFILFPTENPAS